MLICRYKSAKRIDFGVIEGNDVCALTGSPYDVNITKGARVGTIDEVRLLAPTVPSKIVCVGRNYVAHAQEKGNEVPSKPLLFFKPPSALVGHQDVIELLPDMGLVEHEAELAIVIGRGGKNIPPDESLERVLGFTCANDISAREYQAKDGQWARAKGFDTFCPLGPWINTNVNPSNLTIRCTVNGEIRQDANTSQIVFDARFLISYISRIMTLVPGDVILTGTPAGVGPILPGDEVEVEIEQLGILRNSVELAN